MLNRSSLQRVSAECRCFLAIEPNLSELLSDPMTLALMTADHVERPDLDRLIAAARVGRDHHAG